MIDSADSSCVYGRDARSEAAAHSPALEALRVSDGFHRRDIPRALRSCNEMKVFLER
jgi:hypothetical protein